MKVRKTERKYVILESIEPIDQLLDEIIIEKEETGPADRAERGQQVVREKIFVQDGNIIHGLDMRLASGGIFDDICEDYILEVIVVEDVVHTPAPMDNCGSGCVTPRKSSGCGIIMPLKESGNGGLVPNRGYNMVDEVSESMVVSIKKTSR